MKRRQLLISPLVLAFPKTAFAAMQPWSAELLKGGFDGEFWWSGLSIALAPKWKTYWRIPGDGGIAPIFEISGDNIQSSSVSYPMPDRIVTETGTTIGYHNDVVFPFAVVPKDARKPLRLSLKAFFGVCDEVCIPAPYDAALSFDPTNAAAPDQSVISRWRARVPVKTVNGPVTKITAESSTSIVIRTSETILDMFIEGNPSHYFGNPLLMPDRVIMSVSGAESLDELRASPLRITVRTRLKMLEQLVSVV